MASIGRADALRALAASLGRAVRHSSKRLNPLDAARFVSPLRDVLEDINGTLKSYRAADLQERKMDSAPSNVRAEVDMLQALATRPPGSSTTPSTSASAPTTLSASSPASSTSLSSPPLTSSPPSTSGFMVPPSSIDVVADELARIDDKIDKVLAGMTLFWPHDPASSRPRMYVDLLAPQCFSMFDDDADEDAIQCGGFPVLAVSDATRGDYVPNLEAKNPAQAASPAMHFIDQKFTEPVVQSDRYMLDPGCVDEAENREHAVSDAKHLIDQDLVPKPEELKALVAELANDFAAQRAWLDSFSGGG